MEEVRVGNGEKIKVNERSVELKEGGNECRVEERGRGTERGKKQRK